jgi:hypothetical protein
VAVDARAAALEVAVDARAAALEGALVGRAGVEAIQPGREGGVGVELAEDAAGLGDEDHLDVGAREIVADEEVAAGEGPVDIPQVVRDLRVDPGLQGRGGLAEALGIGEEQEGHHGSGRTLGVAGPPRSRARW